MAEASAVAPNADLLDWPKKDKRRFLHAVYRVGDLDRTIQYAILFVVSFSDIFFRVFFGNRGYLFFVSHQVLHWVLWYEADEEKRCSRGEVF